MKKNTRLVLLAVMLVLMVAMTIMVASAATIDVAKGEDLAAKVAGAAAGDTINLTGDVELSSTLTIDKDLTITSAGTVKAGAGFKSDVLIEITGAAHVVVKGGSYLAPATVFKISGTATAEFGDNIIVQNTAAAASGCYAAVDVSTTSTADPAVTLGKGWFTYLGSYDKSESKPNPPSADASTALLINSTAIINIAGGKLSYKYNYDVKASNTSADGSTYGRAITVNAAGATVNMLDGGLYHGGSNYMIVANSGATDFTLNISGGELYFYRLWSAQANSTLHITGGTFRNNAGQPNNGHWIAGWKGCSILIEDGDFIAGTGNANAMFNFNNPGKYVISGGTFNYKQSGTDLPALIRVSDTNADISITGGTFTMAGTQGRLIEKNNGKLTLDGATFVNNNSNAVYIGILGTSGAVTIKNCDFSGTSVGNWLDVTCSASEITIENTTVVSVGHCIYVSPASSVAPKKFTLSTSSLKSLEGRAIKDANGHLTVDDDTICVSLGPDEDAEIFRVNGRLYSWDAALEAVADGGVIEVAGNAQWALIVTVNKTFTIKCVAAVDESGLATGIIGGLVVSAGNVTLEDVTMHTKRGDAIAMSVAGTSLTIKSGSYRSDALSLISITSDDVKVVIEGGTFEQTSSNHLILVQTGTTIENRNAEKVPLLIKAGSFKGNTLNYCINLNSCTRVDVLGGTFEGGQAWFHLNTTGIYNLGDPANPDALVCKDATARAIWARNASRYDGEINIFGGVYSLSKDCGASYLINAAGADINISGGKFSARVAIVSMHDGDFVSEVRISNGEFYGEYTAAIINFTCSGSTKYEDNDGALYITGGRFVANQKGDIINFRGDKPEALIEISGGTFEAADSRIIYCGSCLADVTIKGGTFIAGGARVFYFNSSANTFHIDGGTFILQNKAGGGYADEALIFCSGNAKSTIRITGGTFINQRANSKQLARVQNEMCSLFFAGGKFYMANGDGFYCNDLNDSNNNVPVDKNMKDTVDGVEYYAFVIREGHDFAPIPLLLPTMRVNMEAQGMRFTSIIPAENIDAIKATGATNVSYGTIIVPAEFLKDLEVADGNYIAALKALAASKGVEESKIFVDVPAVEGIIENKKNDELVDITIHASLINIKEENWNRAMVGISYIKATSGEGDTYYFSAANVDASITFAKTAENAYNDLKEAWQKLGTKIYCYRSIKDGKSYSRFAPSVQESLKKYFNPAQ
ncbi:MAG: hypothetical protein IJY16_05075 [Clostridia bacterium]|nr:hypothetical protein [Clostridia bacterium]